MERNIIIRGARQHNLKNINVSIPQNTLTVLTGVSGSGKSTLAFDTLFAEGQRRFVESQSTYVRQFLNRLDKPDVDAIEGLCPTLAVQSRNSARTARSTVGTVTEIYDYLRLIFAKIGVVHCVQCGKPVHALDIDEIVAAVLKNISGSRAYILSPLEISPKLGASLLRDLVRAQGYSYIIATGSEPIDLENATEEQIAGAIAVERDRQVAKPGSDPHESSIFIIVDRINVSPAKRARLADSIETALRQGNGFCAVRSAEPGAPDTRYSQRPVCADCAIAVAPPAPHLLSFNNPLGACPGCSGFGDKYVIDIDAVVPDKSKSLRQGALACWQGATIKRYVKRMYALGEEKLGVPLDTPWSKLTPEQIQSIVKGTREFYGLDRFFNELQAKSYKPSNRYFLRRFRSLRPCPDCAGTRLNPAALSVRLGGKNIAELGLLSLAELLAFMQSLDTNKTRREIVETPMREILSRTSYLVEIGLGYLTLWRLSRTLSGGEMQRIHLASALGSRLTGTLTILDEPTVGLHPRDTGRLIRVLKDIRDAGNTVLIVEHDMQVVREADRIIDMGPGPGERGGEVVYSGTLADFEKNSDSITAKFMRGDIKVGARKPAGLKQSKWITITGAREHNLKNIDASFPANAITCVTGVSGSGKSTLVCDVLYPAIAKFTGAADLKQGDHDSVENGNLFTSVELLGQDPIGRTPRANPATYMDVMSPIRNLFASMPEAKSRRLKPGYFSFNSPAGRCETCEGAGSIKIEMQFLADIFVQCETCGGSRYKPDALQILYNGKSIADVLTMTASEAAFFFRNSNPVKNRLGALEDVALGYLRLGQPLNTLSAGEAQRLKIAGELTAAKKGRTLFLFDEPTMGLHPREVDRFIQCLERLILKGHTIIVIEHNIDVIANADYIIDLGPEGGNLGGQIIASGSPSQIAANKNSITGVFLKEHLGGPVKPASSKKKAVKLKIR